MVGRRIITIFFALFFWNLQSQILEPVHWNFEKNQISENQYELVFTADIDPNWAIYSQSVDEGGPIPTTFFFSESSSYNLIGEVVEDSANMITENDPIFDMVVSKFYTQAIFRQKVKINNFDTPISGVLNFMTCDDTQCLAPEDVDFRFNFSKNPMLNRLFLSK